MGDENEYRYKYNGIEEVDDFGLDLSFAMYRTLDPAIGRWLQIDPMAEKYGFMNPYNSMGNNPMSFSDPNGDDFGLSILIGMAVGAAINAGSQYVRNDFSFNNFNWGSFATSTIAGGVSGGVGNVVGSSLAAAQIGGFYGGAILGASTGFTGGLVNGAFNGNLSVGGLAKSTLLGAGIGGLVGGLSTGKDYRFLDGRSKVLTERYAMPAGHTPTTETSPNQTGTPPMSKAQAIEKGEVGLIDGKVVNSNGSLNINRGFEGDLRIRGNAYISEGQEFYVNADGKDVITMTKSGRINTTISSSSKNVTWGYRGNAIQQSTVQHGLGLGVTVRPNSYIYLTAKHRGWNGFLLW